ncbi:hypothetical protein C0J52_27870 [Blattella germanica]|nr:hypothetical protein C0J52_27870 [Blattella germanica]
MSRSSSSASSDCGKKSRRGRRRSCRRKRKSCSRKRRCSGKYGNNINPFFNFLLCLKTKYKGCSAVVIAKEGGKIWKSMSCQQKQAFIRAACKAQKRCRRRRRSRSRSKSSCRSRSSSRSRSAATAASFSASLLSLAGCFDEGLFLLAAHAVPNPCPLFGNRSTRASFILSLEAEKEVEEGVDVAAISSRAALALLGGAPPSFWSARSLPLSTRGRFEGGGGVITVGNSSDVVGTFISSLKEEEVNSNSTRFKASQITASVKETRKDAVFYFTILFYLIIIFNFTPLHMFVYTCKGNEEKII